MQINTIHHIGALPGLQRMKSNSVNCCVTSPPYWMLRDYGHKDQLGLESTPEAYVESLVTIFREVRRVLRKDGTLWLNIGDTYNGYMANQRGSGLEEKRQKSRKDIERGAGLRCKNLKNKDMIGIPWMLAFALRADGWFLRQDIIWSKPNPMPESINDRCTKAHEYFFLLSKSARYYYDEVAIAEPTAKQKTPIGKGIRFGGKKYGDNPDPSHRTKSGNIYHPTETRNKRSVWTVQTKGFKGPHFATFPPELIKPAILAGCPVGGVVLDCFMGAGTTAIVSALNDRNYIGFEISAEYVDLSNKRLQTTLGMFNPSPAGG